MPMTPIDPMHAVVDLSSCREIENAIEADEGTKEVKIKDKADDSVKVMTYVSGIRIIRKR